MGSGDDPGDDDDDDDDDDGEPPTLVASPPVEAASPQELTQSPPSFPCEVTQSPPSVSFPPTDPWEKYGPWTSYSQYETADRADQRQVAAAKPLTHNPSPGDATPTSSPSSDTDYTCIQPRDDLERHQPAAGRPL